MDLGFAARNTGCHIRICSCLSLFDENRLKCARRLELAGSPSFLSRFASDPISLIDHDNIFCRASRRSVWSQSPGRCDNAAARFHPVSPVTCRRFSHRS